MDVSNDKGEVNGIADNMMRFIIFSSILVAHGTLLHIQINIKNNYTCKGRCCKKCLGFVEMGEKIRVSSEMELGFPVWVSACTNTKFSSVISIRVSTGTDICKKTFIKKYGHRGL